MPLKLGQREGNFVDVSARRPVWVCVVEAVEHDGKNQAFTGGSRDITRKGICPAKRSGFCLDVAGGSRSLHAISERPINAGYRQRFAIDRGPRMPVHEL